jgi:hypothetical protein
MTAILGLGKQVPPIASFTKHKRKKKVTKSGQADN